MIVCLNKIYSDTLNTPNIERYRDHMTLSGVWTYYIKEINCCFVIILKSEPNFMLKFRSKVL